MALFNQRFVKPGLVPTEMGQFYRESFERRQKGDYTIPTVYSHDEVAAWLAQAREFVQTIADLLPPA